MYYLLITNRYFLLLWKINRTINTVIILYSERGRITEFGCWIISWRLHTEYSPKADHKYYKFACPPLFHIWKNCGDIMKARILLLVAFFYLPYFLIAQNQKIQSISPLSSHQKHINKFFNHYPAVSDERSFYLLRITGVDEEDNINFYGFSLSWFHANTHAKFWGLTFNAGLGNPPVQGKARHEISLNGKILAW